MFAVARERGRFAVDRVFVEGTDSLLAFPVKLSAGYRMASRAGGHGSCGTAPGGVRAITCGRRSGAGAAWPVVTPGRALTIKVSAYSGNVRNFGVSRGLGC